MEERFALPAPQRFCSDRAHSNRFNRGQLSVVTIKLPMLELLRGGYALRSECSVPQSPRFMSSRCLRRLHHQGFVAGSNGFTLAVDQIEKTWHVWPSRLKN